MRAVEREARDPVEVAGPLGTPLGSSGLSQGWDAGQGAAGEKGQEVGSRYKPVGDGASSLSQGDSDPSQTTVSFL